MFPEDFFSLYITLIGVLLIIPPCLIYYENDNFLIRFHKGIISEFMISHTQLLAKAKKYTNRTRNTSEKYRIQRLIGKFKDEYSIPRLFFWISGIAVITCIYCIFLAVIAFFYKYTNYAVLLDMMIITSQITLLSMVAIGMFSWCVDIKMPKFYFAMSVLWGIGVVVIGCLDAYCDLFFHIIPPESVVLVFYCFIAIPFICIVMSIGGVCYYTIKEMLFYNKLRKAVNAYELAKQVTSKKRKK